MDNNDGNLNQRKDGNLITIGKNHMEESSDPTNVIGISSTSHTTTESRLTERTQGSSAASPVVVTTDDDDIKRSASTILTVPTESSSTSSFRESIGAVSMQISSLINDNLIVARYIAMFTVSSLGIYAVTQTPLFFRYRNVAEIPSYFFQRRKSFTGRLMICHSSQRTTNSAPPNQTAGSTFLYNRQDLHPRHQNQPQGSSSFGAVTCYVRHLSPIERILSNTWLQRYWNLSHTASTIANNTRPEESASELIKVQIAGIQYPQFNASVSNDPNVTNYSKNWNAHHQPTPDSVSLGQDWIQKMSQQQYLVQCQFLGRQVTNYSDTFSKQYLTKRPIPGMAETTTNIIDSTLPMENKLEQQQKAIVRLYYHPMTDQYSHGILQRFKNLFRRRIDMGESMIQNGCAVVSDNGLFTTTTSNVTSSTTTQDHVVDTNNTKRQIQTDAQYMDQLSRREYEAAQSYAGIWNHPSYRRARSDIVDEIQFQQQSTFLQKIFRWIRGG
jgi:hypothetical protein